VNFKRVEEIAEAVLYEGYTLYPYRPSSVKNQQRFNFGVLYPKTWCDVQGASDSQSLQAECLLKVVPDTRLTIKVRFLQIVQRLIRGCDASGVNECVERLELDGRVWQPWREAEERAFTLEGLDTACLREGRVLNFGVPAGEAVVELRDAQGKTAGEVVRRWQKVAGTLEVSAVPCRDEVMKVRARVENQTDFHVGGQSSATRESALSHSLVSAHVLMGVTDGQFLSLLEIPAAFEDLARSCENTGVWPVLAGDDPTTMLASPIILYDYPQIAPESAGNLFDATEIDEILSLRILTLTDEEKMEMRQSDDRVRQLLQRTENIPEEQFRKLHGAMRGLSLLREDPS